MLKHDAILPASPVRPLVRTDQAALRRGLLGRKFSRKELVQSGILQEKTPGQLASERAYAAGRVQRRLQHRSAGSAADLLGAGAGGASSGAATEKVWWRRGLCCGGAPGWWRCRCRCWECRRSVVHQDRLEVVVVVVVFAAFA